MNFSNYSKSELKKELKKLNIATTDNQSKDELVRLLSLAKASVKRYSKPKLLPNTKKLTIIFLGLLLVIILGFDYYVKSKSVTEVQLASNEPQIFERNNQTFVVYDHPMVRLKVVTDNNCKRIECDMENSLNKIKNSITPLFQSEIIDYRSSYGEKLIEENNINLLPAFIFDETVLSLYDFEDKKDYFTKVNDNYLVYLTPFKSLKSPDLTNAQIISEDRNLDAPLQITVFFSASSPQSKDALKLILELKEKYKHSANIALKHYRTNSADFMASVALECFAKDDKFLEGLDRIFSRQETLMINRDIHARNMLASVNSRLGLKSSDFLKCFDDEEVKEQVLAQYKEAELLGVFGVPTFFVNNNLILGSYNFEDFAKIISQIIEDENIELTQITNEVAE